MKNLRKILAQEGVTASVTLSFLVQEGDEPGTYTILDQGVRPQGGVVLRVKPAQKNLSPDRLVRKLDELAAETAKINHDLGMRGWTDYIKEGPVEIPSTSRLLSGIRKIADKGRVADLSFLLTRWDVSPARHHRKKIPVG